MALKSIYQEVCLREEWSIVERGEERRGEEQMVKKRDEDSWSWQTCKQRGLTHQTRQWGVQQRNAK